MEGGKQLTTLLINQSDPRSTLEDIIIPFNYLELSMRILTTLWLQLQLVRLVFVNRNKRIRKREVSFQVAARNGFTEMFIDYFLLSSHNNIVLISPELRREYLSRFV